MPMPSVGRPAAAQPRLSSLERSHHRHGRRHGVLGVVLVVERGAVQRHHHVADELVERAAMLEHDVDHA